MTHQIHIMDDLPLAFFVFNQDYEVIDCNRAAVDLFAKDKGRSFELVRTYLISHARYIYPNYELDNDFTEQIIRESCNQALEAGVFRFEHTYSTLSGEALLCEVTIVPVKLDDGQGYVHYLRDLNDNHRIQAEIRRREAAEEESRAKSRFLARMSHEIRTPMHAVLGISELLVQNKDLPLEVYEALMRINSSSGLLMATLDDILDLAKVEAGKLEILRVPYETARLISDTVRLNHVHGRNKNLKFVIKVDDNLPCRFIGDELRIKQILNNLLSNAFKYTQSGSVTLSFGIQQNNSGEPCFHFMVEDTGLGLTPKQKEILFDSEFTRFNVQGNPEIIGSGLGMSVVKQLLTLMNGVIYVKSEPNGGTQITVYIPQKIDSEETLGAERAEALEDPKIHQVSDADPSSVVSQTAVDRSPMPYGRVLVVDDVESNVYVAQGILEHYEIGVDTAYNGKEAVEKIANGAVYDMVLMDYMMPGMDGEEATKKIRGLGYTHPIVALTADVLGKTEAFYTERGFDGFLGKPIDMDHMEQYLTYYIRDKYATESLEKPCVLVIDDSPATLTMLNELLRSSYRVLAARDGQTGLLILKEQKVDLILLDIAMPGLSGFDVLKQLRKDNNQIPVIIITASEQPKDQVKGMALGAVDFLRKPFNKQTVLRRVKLQLGAGAHV
jgi:CheY-like chemotaxis protein